MTGNTNGATTTPQSFGEAQTLNLYGNQVKPYKGGVFLSAPANKKLSELDDQGFEICGLAVRRASEDMVTRGIVTNDGLALFCIPQSPADVLDENWIDLIKGVRVDGDSVVLSVKGGNDAARELCRDLLLKKEAVLSPVDAAQPAQQPVKAWDVAEAMRKRFVKLPLLIPAGRQRERGEGSQPHGQLGGF